MKMKYKIEKINSVDEYYFSEDDIMLRVDLICKKYEVGERIVRYWSREQWLDIIRNGYFVE